MSMNVDESFPSCCHNFSYLGNKGKQHKVWPDLVNSFARFGQMRLHNPTCFKLFQHLEQEG